MGESTLEPKLEEDSGEEFSFAGESMQIFEACRDRLRMGSVRFRKSVGTGTREGARGRVNK